MGCYCTCFKTESNLFIQFYLTLKSVNFDKRVICNKNPVSLLCIFDFLLCGVKQPSLIFLKLKIKSLSDLRGFFLIKKIKIKIYLNAAGGQ